VKKLLLIQIRDDGDVMADHELECIQRRLGGRRIEVHSENAVLAPARTCWLDDADAVVIGGAGDYSVHDPRSAHWVTPLQHLVERALARQIPGFAICFGHQLLGQHLGSTVITCERRTEVGTVELVATAVAQNDPVFSHLGPRFTAQTGHSDHVRELPSQVDLLARNDLVETQAFKVRGAPFYSTQFHPDLTGPEGRERYLACKPLAEGMGAQIREQRAARFTLDDDPGSKLLGAFADEFLV